MARIGSSNFWKQVVSLGAGGLIVLLFTAVVTVYVVYSQFRIDVPQGHIAVLVRRVGSDILNEQEIAPDATYKGLQPEVLSEGRHFRNPYAWEWHVYPMVEIPEGKMGIRIRLVGDDLPYGHFVTDAESDAADRQKGIVAEPLRPGRYPINAMVAGQEHVRPRMDYVEVIELRDPVTISAGYKGVVTNLSGPLPEDPNVLLVAAGYRGVQAETLDPGTYYKNPYMYRIEPIDCRSQRFNLAQENHDMGFPSKDGFWVSLDGIIEFRVKPEKAAEVYVTYNEIDNDRAGQNAIDEEIIKKVIMPNARAFCRLRGSNSSGREFIEGDTRIAFQAAFQDAIRHTCEAQGIDIVQALITRIRPPQAIATPVRAREVARQQMEQYEREKLQQDAEAQLAIERALIEQKQALMGAEQAIVQAVLKSKELQQVAVTKAAEELAVARQDLDASRDRASAMLAEKKAEAAVIEYQNEAEAAGWKRSVEAFHGDGHAFARYVMYQKLAPGFRQIMTNTADSPLMAIFQQFAGEPESRAPRSAPQNDGSAISPEALTGTTVRGAAVTPDADATVSKSVPTPTP